MTSILLEYRDSFLTCWRIGNFPKHLKQAQECFGFIDSPRTSGLSPGWRPGLDPGQEEVVVRGRCLPEPCFQCPGFNTPYPLPNLASNSEVKVALEVWLKSCCRLIPLLLICLCECKPSRIWPTDRLEYSQCGVKSGILHCKETPRSADPTDSGTILELQGEPLT